MKPGAVHYSFAAGVGERAAFVTAAVAQAALPSLSALSHWRDQVGLLVQYRKLQDLVCFGSVPIFAAMPFAALPAFGYIFDNSVAQRLLLPTLFLAIAFYMNGTLSISFMICLATGRADIMAKASVLNFVVFPGTVLLILFFGLPGAGAP